jgi:hypothetical protein
MPRPPRGTVIYRVPLREPDDDATPLSFARACGIDPPADAEIVVQASFFFDDDALAVRVRSASFPIVDDGESPPIIDLFPHPGASLWATS